MPKFMVQPGEAQPLPFKGSDTPLMQVVGPGNVEWAPRADLVYGEGIILEPGDIYEWPADMNQAGTVYVVSEVETEMRVEKVG